MSALINWLISTADKGAAGLLMWSWQALVLTACVWLGLKIFRPKSPALRHHIWLLGLIAVAALPLWPSLAQKFPVLQSEGPTWIYVIKAPGVIVDAAPAATAQPSPAVAPFEIAKGAAIKAAGKTTLVRPLLFALWLIGVFALSARLTNSYIRLSRALAVARPVSYLELDCAGDPVSIKGKVRIKLSTEVKSPMLCGVLRQTILLPADIVLWTTPAERAAMIQHELAHVERRDTYIKLLQTAINTIFFFHPLVRFSCRQLSMEREMACDDRVVGLGAAAEVYAEGIIKVAERSLTPGGVSQLALFSAKQNLERRLEMIMNRDRIRVIARQWKYLILPAALIAFIAWLLIPAGSAKSAQSKALSDDSATKLQIVKSMADSKSFNGLLDMALQTTDWELSRLAAIKLTEMEGDGSTAAMVELYEKTSDLVVKAMVIDTLARISEIEPLTEIALADQSPELRERALLRVKWLKETSESADVKAMNVALLQEQLNQYQLPAPPPPPPPPPPPHADDMTIEIGKEPASLRWHNGEDSVFDSLRKVVYAYLRHDASQLERILDDDYIGTGPNGETLNKAQEIAESKRLDDHARKFEFDDLRVSGNDGMALATFLGTTYLEANGQNLATQFRYTVTFSRHKEGWKVTSIHVSFKQ